MTFLRVVIGALASGFVTPALAQEQPAQRQTSEIVDPVACSGDTPTGTIWDVGGIGANNSVGNFDQSVVGAVGVLGICAGEHARVRVEASYNSIDDDIGTSEAYLIGLGLAFNLTPEIALTPSIYYGREDIYFISDSSDYVGTALTYQYTNVIEGNRPSYVQIEGRPEVVYRDDNSSGSETQFVNYVGLGYDRPLIDGLRGRVKLGHRYIDTDFPTDSVVLATASIGGVNAFENYNWIFDLTYSKGNGDYEGVLIGLTFRGVLQ